MLTDKCVVVKDDVMPKSFDCSQFMPARVKPDATVDIVAAWNRKASKRRIKNKRAAQSRKRNRKPYTEKYETLNIRGEVVHIVKFKHTQR